MPERVGGTMVWKCRGCGETVPFDQLEDEGAAGRGHVIPGSIPDLCGPVEPERAEFWCVRVHLTSGEVVEGDAHEMTDEQLAHLKKAMGDLCSSSDGWQVSVERGGSWFVFPKQSVLYMEVASV